METRSATLKKDCFRELLEDTTRPSLLLNLPPKLLVSIACHCWTSSYRDVPVYDQTLDRSVVQRVRHLSANDSLSLRLVCRRINEIILRSFGRRFFEDLTVIFTIKSLQRLVDVSVHGKLSRFTRRLTIGHHILPAISDLRKRFDTNQWAIVKYFYSAAMWEILTTDMANSEHAMFTSGFLAEARQQAFGYRHALLERRTMQYVKADVSMLTCALDNLNSTLEAVEIASTRSDGNPIPHWGEQALLTPVGIRNRNFLLRLGINTTFIAEKLCIAVRDTRIRNKSFNLQSLRIDKPERNLSAHAEGLQLQNFGLDYPFWPGRDRLFFPGLQHLRLGISQFSTGDDSTSELHTMRRAWAQFLGPKLETLCLDIGGGLKEPRVHESIADRIVETLSESVASQGHERHLRALEITGPAPIKIPDLASILTDNAQNLRTVRFDLRDVWVEEEVRGLDNLCMALFLCESLEVVDFQLLHRATKFSLQAFERAEVESLANELLSSAYPHEHLVKYYRSELEV